MTPEWIKSLRQDRYILAGIAEVVQSNDELLEQLKTQCQAMNTPRSQEAARWLNQVKEMLEN